MTDWQFNREAIRSFRFVRADFQANTGVAELVYAFDQGPELIETITFPGAPFTLDDSRNKAVERALPLLHLIAGVSYYKAAVPSEIRIDDYAIDADTAALLTEIYENGLGEFAYRNGISLRGRIRFPANEPSPSRGEEARLRTTGSRADERPSDVREGRNGWGGDGAALAVPSSRTEHHPHPNPPLEGEGAMRTSPPLEGEGAVPVGLTSRAITAIGGGKDSLVSIEALRAAVVEQTVTWIGSSPLIATCAARTGLPTLNISRQLAPQLFEYNRQGAYNGHIPVTAINSAILVLAALLHGFDQVVFSNERSASYGSEILDQYGNVVAEVNHQWSKSWAFERAFGDYVEKRIASDLHYYSLLRPLSELAVARQFAKTDHYDAHFSSCNRNFHILGERPVNRWCGQCPKCHFVFLALAPFMPKPRLLNIFGRNLLDDASLAPGFDALIEYRDHKPFECVGEGREARAAFAALAMRPAWREDALVARFDREIAPQLGADLASIDALLPPKGEHRIPSELWEKLRAHFAT